MSDAPDDELDERVAQLADVLGELRRELDAEPPRGPLGLPRPPTPRELLRFTDEQAIPAAIAVLEANIRALELLRAAIRLSESERAARAGGRDVRERAERASRATLDRLDDALVDVQSELEQAGLPPDDEARTIVQDARDLRAEIRERLSRPTDESPVAIDVEDSAALDRPDAADPTRSDDARTVRADDSPPEVDVDEELRSIRDEMSGEDESNDDSAGDGDSSDDGE